MEKLTREEIVKLVEDYVNSTEGMTLPKLGKMLGKSSAYLYQFCYNGKPREMPNDIKMQLARITNTPLSKFDLKEERTKEFSEIAIYEAVTQGMVRGIRSRVKEWVYQEGVEIDALQQFACDILQDEIFIDVLRELSKAANEMLFTVQKQPHFDKRIANNLLNSLVESYVGVYLDKLGFGR